MSKFFDGLEKYIYWTSIPKIGLNDIVDILIVSVMIYLIVKWIKTTRAWVLLKGIIILLCIAFAAYLLQLHTVSWILSNTMSVGITAILIVFIITLDILSHCHIFLQSGYIYFRYDLFDPAYHTLWPRYRDQIRRCCLRAYRISTRWCPFHHNIDWYLVTLHIFQYDFDR